MDPILTLAHQMLDDMPSHDPPAASLLEVRSAQVVAHLAAAARYSISLDATYLDLLGEMAYQLVMLGRPMTRGSA